MRDGVDVTLEKLESEEPPSVPAEASVEESLDAFQAPEPPVRVLTQAERSKRLYALDRLLRDKRISQAEYEQRKEETQLV